MNEEQFQRKLAELVSEIGTLPPSEREKLELLAEETKIPKDAAPRIQLLQYIRRRGLAFLKIEVEFDDAFAV